MSWWVALGIVAWAGAVALILVFFHAVYSVSATAAAEPELIGSSFPADYQDGLIENCLFTWDPATKTVHIRAVTPSAHLMVRNNCFDGANEVTWLFGEKPIVFPARGDE